MFFLKKIKVPAFDRRIPASAGNTSLPPVIVPYDNDLQYFLIKLNVTGSIQEGITINNTSKGKWDSLSTKQADQQFVTEMIHGLSCSPFEASAILDTLYKVYTPYFETSLTLNPGQPPVHISQSDHTFTHTGRGKTVLERIQSRAQNFM